MATILDLLMALNRGDLPPLPDPAKPVGMPLPVGAPPVMTMPAGPPPDLPPTAPLPPLDLNLINQIAGQQPVAPTVKPPSTLAKIGAVLSGIGLGPDYATQLREERQRPMREYNAALERYQGRRTQGIEFATRKQEREQDRVQRQAEAQADRAFQEYTRRANFTDRTAFEQVQQAHEMAKFREKERADREEQERQLKAAKEKQRNDIYAKLVSQDFAPTGHAGEIADNIVFGKPMSAAAEKWRSVKAQKLEAQLARVGGGSGGATGPVMAQLQNGQVVPLSAVDKQSGGVMLNGDLVPVVGYVGGRIPARPQQPTPTFTPQASDARLPGFDFSSMLQPQPTGQMFTRAQVKEYARKSKRKPADVEADLKARGFTVE